MTNLSDHPAHNPLRHVAALALSVCLTLALAACGPGTGGTGTGPVTSTLSFGSASVSGSVTTPGTGCATNCQDASLRLDAGRVEFTAACLRFVFNGDWGVDAQGQTLLAAQVESTHAGVTAVLPARLQLQFSDGVAASAGVTVSLTDASGRLLWGPFTLPRNDVAAGTPAPACPAG